MPESLSGAPTEALGWPRVLVIEYRPDGIFLLRYTEDGSFAGDTWHQALEDAQAQAVYEYGSSLSTWTAIPESADDPLAFALRHAEGAIEHDV